MNPDAKEELPHSSDDPQFVETWFFNAIDLANRTVVWVHCSWLPARQMGAHQIVVSVDGKTTQRRVVSTSPLKSGLLELQVDPWTRMRLVCPDPEVDITWSAIMDVLDFGARMAFDAGRIRQDHYQCAGEARGTVTGGSFAGRGWRDRSVGPRNTRRLGKHHCLSVIGATDPVLVTLTALHAPDKPCDAAADSTFSASVIAGRTSISDSPVAVSRRLNATPYAFHFPDDLKVEVDLDNAVAWTIWITDPTSEASSYPTTEPVYCIRDWYLPAYSPTLGDLVGFYEEGQLFTN